MKAYNLKYTKLGETSHKKQLLLTFKRFGIFQKIVSLFVFGIKFIQKHNKIVDIKHKTIDF